MNFCLLSENDARALLAFEQINKEWFEQFIEAREDSFYSLSAVEMHIKAFLSAYNKRKMYPGIIKDNNSKVVGRANLRVLNPQDATIGYRIAIDSTKQGLATLACEHLIKLAIEEFNLKQLMAYVSVENPASAKVLTKFGFEQANYHREMAMVAGKSLDCYEYRLSL